MPYNDVNFIGNYWNPPYKPFRYNSAGDPGVTSGTAVISDSGMAMEMIAGFRNDIFIGLENVSSISRDSILFDETLLNVLSDKAIASEIIARVISHSTIEIENTGTIAVTGDAVVFLDLVSALRKDALLYAETVSSFSGDASVSMEILRSVRSDALPQDEWLEAVRRDFSAFIENTGTIAVTGDGTIGAEWSSLSRSDSAALCESIARFITDARAQLEATLAVVSDKSVFLETITGLVFKGDGSVAIEWTLSVRRDIPVSTEVGSMILSLSGDSVIMFEMFSQQFLAGVAASDVAIWKVIVEDQ